ncbi:DUF421 domain-containing protein [Spirosoma sp. KUDC1026]|uniref:DUF421 domain-containing protein n=1 Tax=Spirosoma sp. KUDC1026 TaxID=2745947 RepID=UPI00159BC8BE|nr:YetF domain-containing protein [Spirosoma sp. KUDC1026]QKZ13021.1 DUF421 domain-containing protein [Spirosoma sp. KUDC1026]
MKKEEIRLDDWQRILFGMAPPEFLLETLVRAIVIYLILLVVVRLLGKRMSGQLTLTEMSVMVTIGAIISPSLQAPDRGIALGVLAMICTLTFQRGITLLGFDNKKIEQLTQGETSMLVKDGIMQIDAMSETRISKQQLFAQLRKKNVYNVSLVKRMYIEAAGSFSIYPYVDKDRPGLSTLPPGDQDVHTIQQSVVDKVACTNCGHTVDVNQQNQPCSVCQETVWTQAVL